MNKWHLSYTKNTSKGIWFKRKRYGWGWTPARWQGWLIIVIYTTLVTICASRISVYSSDKEMWLTFIVPMMILTSSLIGICYTKGEKPKWQWGEDKEST